jgi:hypothetical protein
MSRAITGRWDVPEVEARRLVRAVTDLALHEGSPPEVTLKAFDSLLKIPALQLREAEYESKKSGEIQEVTEVNVVFGMPESPPSNVD